MVARRSGRNLELTQLAVNEFGVFDVDLGQLRDVEASQSSSIEARLEVSDCSGGLCAPRLGGGVPLLPPMVQAEFLGFFEAQGTVATPSGGRAEIRTGTLTGDFIVRWRNLAEGVVREVRCSVEGHTWSLVAR